MAADFVYVIMFPQLTAVLYVPWTNAYGSLPGFLVGLALRLCAGEEYLNLPAAIKYPKYTVESGQLFPYRTFSMVCSFLVILLGSAVARFLFRNGRISRKWDVLNNFTPKYAEEKEHIDDQITKF